MTRVNQTWSALVAALAATFLLGHTAVAHAQPGPGTNFRVCTRAWGTSGDWGLNGHAQFFRTTAGNPGVDNALWPAAVTVAYRRAWEGYWYLDTTNSAIWIDESSFTMNTFTSNFDNKVVHRANFQGGGLFGQVQGYFVWPSNVPTNMDIYVSGPTSSVTRASPAVATSGVSYAQSCVRQTLDNGVLAGTFGGFTEAGTFAHEVGHGYGYDHFDAWVSLINTSQIDVFSCELNTAGTSGSQFLTPDAKLTQCHDLTYGVGVPTDRDISITPVFQPTGCNLVTTGCATIAGSASTVTIATNSTSRTDTYRFTTLMNRGGIGAEGVFVGTFLSRNRVWDASDVRIDEYFNTTDWQPGSTIPKARTVTFNPQIAMPVRNVEYFVLVVVDHDGYFTETRESNNVTDLGVVYRRL